MRASFQGPPLGSSILVPWIPTNLPTLPTRTITRNTLLLTTLARFIAIYEKTFPRIALEPGEIEVVLNIDFENREYYNVDHFIRELLI